MFRLFIDEFGHHDMKSSDDPNQRYLGLSGVIMRVSYAEGRFAERLAGIKQEVFGRSDFSLHRREILDAKTQPFARLRDHTLRKKFDAFIFDLIETATYRVVTVIIDKKEHRERYAVWHFQPYHYCLTVLLERYALFLSTQNDIGDVMAESREKKDNKRLSRAYQYLYRNGTDNVAATFFQRWLSTTEIKIKRKTDNVAGLQLADLIVNPSCRELICAREGTLMTADFSKKVVEILYREKYRRSSSGKVAGWGTKWLP
jgi:hypothetical protein